MSGYFNEIARPKFSWWGILLRQFKNPLLLVFLIATIVSFAVGQKTEASAIWIVMTFSILLGFFNEYQAERTVNDLIKKISFVVKVIRGGQELFIPVKEVIIGDEALLHAGSIVPADIRLKTSENLEVNESVLTGESFPVSKKAGDSVYMGTVITGGAARGEVYAIGMSTKFGRISELSSKARPMTEFQKGLKDFSSLLAKIALVTVLLIIISGFFLHHPAIETILFALTVAMGITPELLPLIVTLSLARGARELAKKNVITKQFVSIEDLGNMEVLCTDKTGTLTEGKISVSYVDESALNYGLLCNSGFTHKNTYSDGIDKAIVTYAKSKNLEIGEGYETLFEIPFNFENRFMTVVVKNKSAIELISKGSPEAILSRCRITPIQKADVEKRIEKLQSEGLRIIGVGVKEIKTFNQKLIKTEQKDLVFKGLIGFSDIPKKDLGDAFKKFAALGVKIKIVTGDNEIVAQKVCRDVGFAYSKTLTGPQVEKMNDLELLLVAWKTDIFARVTPSQKDRIIQALKKDSHTIGYLGDGINDAPALRVADVGVSVNTAVDVAKDAASIVILRKSLSVIADGIRQGRITFQNTIKYVLMGTSSDFGNMISQAAASVFLPFLPMTPVQVLLTDILYDVSQLSIPTDNVDAESINRPKNWNISYIKRFMLTFGPISTIYDFLTFAVMYFVFKARAGMFQTGWFVESLITEVLVVFVIRTRRIPFIKSRASLPLIITCVSVVLLCLYLPFSPFADSLGFQPLPPVFFVILLLITLTYLILVEVGKYLLNKEYPPGRN